MQSAILSAFDVAHGFMGLCVRYESGDMVIPSLRVIPGDARTSDIGLPGTHTVFEQTTFRLLAKDLVFSGELVRPERGDRIFSGDRIYEVLPLDEDQQAWSANDPYGLVIMVHATLTEDEAQ